MIFNFRKTLKRKIILTKIVKEELLKRERSGNLQTLVKGDSLKIGLRYINSDNHKSNEFTVNDIVEKLSSHPIKVSELFSNKNFLPDPLL